MKSYHRGYFCIFSRVFCRLGRNSKHIFHRVSIQTDQYVIDNEYDSDSSFVSPASSASSQDGEVGEKDFPPQLV